MITPQPVKPSYVILILVVITLVLAMTAGYYQALYQTEQLKYQQLELEYRSAIGENS